MTDWDTFEARARKAIPALALKAKRCWIGVLTHHKTPEDMFDEHDFVWMIGHSKITIQKIRDTYQNRNQNVEFQIRFKDDLVEKTDETIKSFLQPHGDLVLFLARRTDQTHEEEQPAAHNASACIETVIATPNKSPANPLVTNRVKSEPEDDDSSLPRSLNLTHSVRPTPPGTTVESPPTTPMLPDDISSRSASAATPPGMPTAAVPESLNGRNDGATSAFRDHHNNAKAGGPSSPLSNAAIKSETIPDPQMDETTQIAFDPEGYFDREPTPEPASQGDVKTSDRAIREVIAQQDADMLEAGVAQSMKILQHLQLCFSQRAESPDCHAWNEAIEKLIPQAARKRTVVGVVGNTGAGKSSVINAMLEEERLVPTNCMRACTAVVTEMSWNTSTESLSKYRAEVEFITPSEWEKELVTLLKEFLTESGGVSKDVADENSDAGIAWAKFHSVYPKRTRDSLSNCSVEDLMAERSVLAVLGTTKKIASAYPNPFYQQLQKYVDSKEKVSKKTKDKGIDKDKLKKSFEMEYWPLIKVVRIYVKAKALSTGAVIVDLPGVHDSNAARAAVAQGYMKQCTGLWIVAPITRAVDDKAAKTLLGDTFKRQLKYDGGFSSVTFICSKTDDISITEAIDTLELEDEVQGLYAQQDRLEQKIEMIKENIDELQESREVYQIAYSETSEAVEIWEELNEQLDEEQTVYAPLFKTNKRKKSQSKQKYPQKRRLRGDYSDPEPISSDEENARSGTASGDEGVRALQTPLTEEEIKAKLKELREAKKVARRSSLELLEKIKELKPQVGDCKAKIATIKAEISHICIAGRNDYSKRAIQHDFAAGIKELDQENAAEEDEDNFNPDEDRRDYDEVAKSLPVFCVSSRAYQQMSGRLRKDDSVPGFKTAEETEMPQLQAHCKKLTEVGRIQTARTFLLNFCQQLTTFSLWASDDGTGSKMTDADKRKQVRYLEKKLSELEKGLEESVRACLNVMKKEMHSQIFDKYPALIDEAINAAPNTATGWGAHRSEGGLFYQTYKALVRRDGRYHSPTAGHRDFNAELVDPIVKKLAAGWERAFQNKLPKAFEAFTKASGKLLHNFHEAVEERARSNGAGLASLAALKTQIYTYEQLFADLDQVLITKMNELQREANRDFTPTIANIMRTVYDTCADESGTGSFKRMKEYMRCHVDQHRHMMFYQATLTVKHHLDSLCKALEDLMEEKADEIYVKMRGDYTRVLGGGQLQTDQVVLLPKAERALRAEVLDILKSADTHFEPIVRGEFDHEAAEAQTEAPAGESMNVDEDDEDGAFESAREPTGNNGGDLLMGGMEDTVNTDATAPKHNAVEMMDMENTSEKENHALLTPIDDDMYEVEEI